MANSKVTQKMNNERKAKWHTHKMIFEQNAVDPEQ